jgi:hypothetical protein
VSNYKNFVCSGCGLKFVRTPNELCESGLCRECCFEECWNDEREEGMSEETIRAIHDGAA